MKLHDIQATSIITSLREDKPEKGVSYLERILLESAKDFKALLDDGYSEDQIYNKFPTAALDEIDVDKKTFIRKLKGAINKYKKTLNGPKPKVDNIPEKGNSEKSVPIAEDDRLTA